MPLTPHARVAHPDRPTAHPDRPVAHPDGPTAHPDRPVAHPDRPVAHSDSPTAHPDRPPRVDVHQHLWTPPLLNALAARDRLPFVRETDGIATVHCAGEQAWAIDLNAESARERAELVHRDGLDLALIALSSPIGIEALPRAQARELIDAHLAGIDDLGPEFAAWGPVPLDQPDPADVDDVLARGCVGISLPAGALASADALDRVNAILERAAQHGAPLFVHPGPASGDRPAQPSLDQPLWWEALTGYVAQMQAAWLSFATVGRREHPGLQILFAMLAGGAPLLSERLAARGGPPIDLKDGLTFYETSSYGPQAIAAMANVVDTGQLVYGSDRPVVEPTPTAPDDHDEHDETLKTNAAHITRAQQPAPAVAA